MLGDIDADQVTISATGAENQPVSAAELGFRGAFNYCAQGVTPKPSCSRPGNEGTDLPVWNAATETLVGNGPDTAGASAWFEPTVALSTLTFTYAQKSGSPVFQTWFSALAYDLTGTISRSDENGQPIRGVKVDLYDPSGDLVGSTTTDDAGQYAFDNQATYQGYRVEVERPAGLTSPTLSTIVDLSRGDQVADFALRSLGPSPASGTVTDRETNEPVEGVTVHLSGPGNLERTTTTLADGSYLFDSVPDGDGYVVTIDGPDGFQDNPTEQTFTAPPDSDAPITGLDFDLVRVPSGEVAGTVSNTAGDPIENVLITITGPGDEIRELRTDRNKKYDLAGLTPGPYTITVTAPDGDTVMGVASQPVTVPTNGGQFLDQDFEIRVPPPAPTYSIDGTVLDVDGQPVPGATVSAESSDGGAPQTVIVDNDGNFQLPGLPAGGWDLTVSPPADYTTSGPQQVGLTNADRTGIEFTLTPTATPTPSVSPTPAPTVTVTSNPTPAPTVSVTSNPTPAPTVSVTSSPTPAPTVSVTSSPTDTTAPTITSASTPTRSPVVVSAGAPAGTQLADTGGPSIAPLLFGLGAALIGSFCLLTVRRRRSRSRSR